MKEITRVDPTTGFIATLDAAATMVRTGERTWREGALRWKRGDVIVDTTFTAFDTGKAETAISTNNEEDWKIVEQYDDEKEARIGHEKWVKKMESEPSTELKDIGVWG